MRLTIIAFFALLFGMNTAIADGHDKANAFGFALNVPAEHIAEVEAVLASHMKASTGGSDLPKMQEMMVRCGVGAVYPGFHMQSMNR